MAAGTNAKGGEGNAQTRTLRRPHTLYSIHSSPAYVAGDGVIPIDSAPKRFGCLLKKVFVNGKKAGKNTELLNLIK